jgi:hypothetical protein
MGGIFLAPPNVQRLLNARKTATVCPHRDRTSRVHETPIQRSCAQVGRDPGTRGRKDIWKQTGRGGRVESGGQRPRVPTVRVPLSLSRLRARTPWMQSRRTRAPQRGGGTRRGRRRRRRRASSSLALLTVAELRDLASRSEHTQHQMVFSRACFYVLARVRPQGGEGPGRVSCLKRIAVKGAIGERARRRAAELWLPWHGLPS